MHRRRACSSLLGDVRANLLMNRNFDSATHLVRALGGEVTCRLPRRASVEVAFGEVAPLSFSGVARWQEPRAQRRRSKTHSLERSLRQENQHRSSPDSSPWTYRYPP